MKTLFMETTKIEPSQTVSEIQKILGKYGASAIMIEYQNGEVSAVSFEIKVNAQHLPFRLPCRWEAIFKILRRRVEEKNHWPDYLEKKEPEWKIQAKRIAWRQILRWIEAQLALVETGMVKIQEVFMPYIQVGIDETFYDRLEATKFKMVEYKGAKEKDVSH